MKEARCDVFPLGFTRFAIGRYMMLSDTIGSRIAPSTVATGKPDTLRGHAPVSVSLLLGAVRLGDAIAMIAAALMTWLLMPLLGVHVDWRPQLLLAMAGTTASGFALAALNSYSVKQLTRLRRRLVTRTIAAAAGVPLIVLCVALIPGSRAMFPTWPITWFLCTLVVQSAGHGLLATVVKRWVAQGRLSRRVVVVGLNHFSTTFLARAARQADIGLEVVGLYRDESDGPGAEHAGHRVLGQLEDIVTRSRRERIDAVVLAIPLTEPERIANARRVLRSMVADVYLTTGLAGLQFQSREVLDFAATPMVKVGSRPLSTRQNLQKAALDRVLAFILLLVLSPLLGIIALLIKMETPGPVLFRQPRLGFNNNLYTVYKFRTMHHKFADLMANQQTTRGDVRITKVGRVLRRLSLDELPQLLNVLGGSMSLVGPRPHAPNTKAGNMLFHDAVVDYALRHRVKPGITGWAQVNGWRGETTTVEHIEQRVLHDLYYIDNWSLAFDIRILMLTVLREIYSKTAF